MHDGHSTFSGLANRLSTELAAATADAEAARLAEAQISTKLSLHEAETHLSQAKLQAGQDFAQAAVLTMASAYGETLVPREWLSSISEELEERTVGYKSEMAVMTNMVDVSASLQAELQQRQNVMEKAVTAKLRMVAMGHAASRIQFGFLRYRLRSCKTDTDKLRRTGTSLSMAVKLAEQERDVERQTLTQTLGQAQAKVRQTEEAYEATLAELHAVRTSSAEAFSQEIEEMSKKQKLEHAGVEHAAELREREYEVQAQSLERALVAASVRLQRERSASKIQHTYRKLRVVASDLQLSSSQAPRLTAEQHVAEASAALASSDELHSHEEQAAHPRERMRQTDSSDSSSDASGIISYTTGLGSLNQEYVHSPSPGRTSIVITGEHATSTLDFSRAAHGTTTDGVSNPKPLTATDDSVVSRNELSSILGPQGVNTRTLLETNELATEPPLAAESDTLRLRLSSAEADLKAIQTEFKTLLSELTRECGMVTFYAWLGPEPRLSSHYSFHQGSCWVLWGELREAILRLHAASHQNAQLTKTQQSMKEELAQLTERVAEAEREADNVQLASSSKDIHLRLKEEGLNAYAREIEGRAKGWEEEHAAAMNALEQRAVELKQEHQAAMTVLHNELEESRLEREAVQFEQVALSPPSGNMHSGDKADMSQKPTPEASAVPELELTTQPSQHLETATQEPAKQGKPTTLQVATTKVARMMIADKKVSDWSFSVSKSAPSVVGRSARKTDAHCVLPGTAADKGISRKHAQIEYDAPSDEFVLTCLGVNVVKLNNQVVGAHDGAVSLKDGDRLRFGSVEVAFFVTDEPVAPEPEPELQTQARAQPPATLTSLHESDCSWTFDLSKSAVSTIGRGTKSDSTTPAAECALPGTAGENTISREHAQIKYSAAGDKYMLSSLGSNVVILNHDRTVDAQHGPIVIKDGDILTFGSSANSEPMEVRVNIPPPLEHQSSVKELVRTFTSPPEENAMQATDNPVVIKEESEKAVAGTQEPSGNTLADRLMKEEKDLDTVLEGIETRFIRAEAERCIQQERKANNAKLEQMQVRLNAAESRAAAAIEDSNNYAAKVSQLSQDLEKSTEIASTAIAEASRLRTSLQQKHGKDGQEVLRLNAELDVANKAVEAAHNRIQDLTGQLEQAMKDAARLKEEHELDVSMLQIERDEARYQAQLSEAEAHAWAQANPYRMELSPPQPDSISSSQVQSDEVTEMKLQQVIMASDANSGTGAIISKGSVGTEDVGPAAYEKQLKSAMAQAEQLLATDARQGNLQVRGI